MSWQEELRKLDEELAAGQISADDYRVRRDQVLSSAVSFGPAGQSAQADKPDETQFIQTGPPTPPPTPQVQPPAPYAQPPAPPAQPHQGASDKTQVVGDQGSQNDADKTQIVPGDQADRTQAVGGWQTARPSDADRTQVVPGVPPQAYAGGQPPRPAPDQGGFPPGYPPPMGWQQQPEEDLGSPWGGAEFPPLAPTGSPDWIRQGPEVFETDRKSKTGRILAIVAIVVLLAGLGVGGYFLLRDKGNNQTQPPASTEPAPQTTTSKPSPRPTTSTPPPKPVVTPPGAVQVDSSFTLARLGEVKILSPEDFEIFSRNQITQAQVQVTKEGELTRGTWAFTAPDRAVAETIFKEIDTLYRQVNFKPAPDITRENVTALWFAPTPAGSGPTVYRAHYLAGNKVIRVETYGPDPTVAATEFASLLDAQLQRTPAAP